MHESHFTKLPEKNPLLLKALKAHCFESSKYTSICSMHHTLISENYYKYKILNKQIHTHKHTHTHTIMMSDDSIFGEKKSNND